MIGYLDGNRVTLLRSGAQYFPALERSIEQARAEIYLETYIFADDQTGRSIAAALCRASQRGVRVHVLLDGFGAKDMAEPLRQRMLDAGVGLLVYRRKISPLTLRRHRLRRMHRKIAVVDGCIAFVGGINVIDDTNTPGQDPPRHDQACQDKLAPALSGSSLLPRASVARRPSSLRACLRTPRLAYCAVPLSTIH